MLNKIQLLSYADRNFWLEQTLFLLSKQGWAIPDWPFYSPPPPSLCSNWICRLTLAIASLPVRRAASLQWHGTLDNSYWTLGFQWSGVVTLETRNQTLNTGFPSGNTLGFPQCTALLQWSRCTVPSISCGLGCERINGAGKLLFPGSGDKNLCCLCDPSLQGFGN